MKSSLLYRISSVLLVLFGATHTYGLFDERKRGLMADTVMASMRAVHFDIMGFNRSWWELYAGFGLLLTVFLLFSAIFAWQLGSLTKQHAGIVRSLGAPFALCHGAVAVLCWTNFFLAPAIVSSVIAACLVVAAWQTASR